MINRRLFLTSAALMLAAALPARSLAQEADGLKDLLSGIAGAASRRYIEKHRDDAEWDGQYYYDRYDRKRYSREDWLKELERRDREERSGRDWRDAKRRAWEEKRYGKNYRDFSRRPDDRNEWERDIERNRRERERMRRDEERVRRMDEAVRRRDEAIRREDERRARAERERAFRDRRDER